MVKRRRRRRGIIVRVRALSSWLRALARSVKMTATDFWLVVGDLLRASTGARPRREPARTRSGAEAAEATGERAGARHADLRTIREQALAERGGLTSEQGVERYESGLHPGGLHRKAVRRPEDRASDDFDEPEDRVSRHPGGTRHMPATRRGA